jgi:hypothetical protein
MNDILASISLSIKKTFVDELGVCGSCFNYEPLSIEKTRLHDAECSIPSSDKAQEAMRFMAMSMPWQYFIQAELKVSGSFFSICLQLESELERISILPFLSSFCYTEVNNLLSMHCV